MWGRTKPSRIAERKVNITSKGRVDRERGEMQILRGRKGDVDDGVCVFFPSWLLMTQCTFAGNPLEVNSLRHHNTFPLLDDPLHNDDVAGEKSQAA